MPASGQVDATAVRNACCHLVLDAARILLRARDQEDGNADRGQLRPGVGDPVAGLHEQRELLRVRVEIFLAERIGEHDLRNVRIVEHDAVEVLEHMIVPGSLAGVHLFFPDPWHKARHAKRRIVQAPFARLVASRLASGARLHAATDWQPYAQQMLEVLGAEPLLANTAEGYAPRPAVRPLTKFEQRGLGLGHAVYDLVFVRR